MPRGAPPALSSYFETHYLDGKIFLRGDLALQPLERGTVKLFDLSAMEARQMEMVLLCLDLVIMLFPVQVHQVQLIDQPQAFEQFKGPVNGRAIDVGSRWRARVNSVAASRWASACWMVSINARLCAVKRTPRASTSFNRSQRFGISSSCDSFALCIIYDKIGPITTAQKKICDPSAQKGRHRHGWPIQAVFWLKWARA